MKLKILAVIILTLVSIPIKTSSETLTNLMGPITNVYGIRNDILEYIEKTISHENKKARKAVITIAQELQFHIYKAKSDEDVFKSIERTMTAMKCLSQEYPYNNDGYHIFKEIEALMTNTRPRFEYFWTYNGKYIGARYGTHTVLPDEQLIKLCETGDY